MLEMKTKIIQRKWEPYAGFHLSAHKFLTVDLLVTEKYQFVMNMNQCFHAFLNAAFTWNVIITFLLGM